ncbi:MAG: mandelate racemase/muconate lactonizing enzyme family protein [Chloroflexi bacterium]|nr:mandelate racemase/muconate lactonizing enzyme family protein [Chloroflexota bacterium]
MSPVTVTKVSTVPLSVPLNPPRGGSGHPLGPTFLTYCLVRVDTDAGITGWGEISDGWGCEYAKVADALVTEAFSRFVIGRDPREVDDIMARAWGWLRRRQGLSWLTCQAGSGVEIALWDAMGKILDRPVCEMLGGARTPVPVYVSGGFLSQGDAGVHHDFFAPSLAQGIPAAKVRLGVRWEQELDTLAELHRRLPGVTLFVDGNEAFSLKTAARIAPRLAECGVGFFEEPCVRDDPAGLARLVATSPVPIAYGEHAFGVHGFLELLDGGLADIWQPDALVCGGLSPMRRIVALAAARNIRVAPHSAGTPLGLAANIHGICGAPTLMRLEYSGGNEELTRAFPGSAAIGRDAVRNGAVMPPAGPGLGVEPAPDVAERFPYQTPPPVTQDATLYMGRV